MKTESKFQNITFYIFIIFAILYFIYYRYSKQQIIFGFDYYLFIWILPIILGLIILFIIRKKYLLNKLKSSNNPLIGFWFLFQGIIFAHLTIGLISLVVFEKINAEFIADKNSETLNCKISQLVSLSNNSQFVIDFNIKGESKRIRINRKTYFEFNKKELNEYFLKFEFKSGLLGTITKVKSEIVEKNAI